MLDCIHGRFAEFVSIRAPLSRAGRSAALRVIGRAEEFQSAPRSREQGDPHFPSPQPSKMVSIRAPLSRAGRCRAPCVPIRHHAVSIRAPLSRAGRWVIGVPRRKRRGVSIRAPLSRAGRCTALPLSCDFFHVSIRAPLSRAGRSNQNTHEHQNTSFNPRPALASRAIDAPVGTYDKPQVSIRAPLSRAGRCGPANPPKRASRCFNPRPALASRAMVSTCASVRVDQVSIRAPLSRAGRFPARDLIGSKLMFQSAPRSREQGDPCRRSSRRACGRFNPRPALASRAMPAN